MHTMFGSPLAKSTDIQTFPYTKPLSPASDIEYFLHLSPFGSEFPARSLLYAISPMPRFGTFCNKSLTAFASGLAALERLYSSGSSKPQDSPHHTTHSQNSSTLQISTSHPLPPPLKQPDIWLWLSRIWKSSNQFFSFSSLTSLFPPLFPSDTPPTPTPQENPPFSSTTAC